MEPNTTFVGPYGTVELYTVTDVHMYFPVVIYPGNTKGKNTIGLNNAFYDARFVKFRMLVVYILDRNQHFSHGLKVFRLARMFGLELCHYVIHSHIKKVI